MTRWSEDKARNWQSQTGWLLGCNFLPSYAVNFMDFWHEARFDLDAIARELALAAQTGLNSVRVNLNFDVWRAEGEAHMRRVDAFLDKADAQGLRVVLVPFDDCQFSGAPSAYALQADPAAGTHNSRAIGSPGREAVLNWQNIPELQEFFSSVIERYKSDPRIVIWDLYNEPGNRMQFINNQHSEFDEALEDAALTLMEACFSWARAINPEQPLTVGAWHLPYDWDHYQVPEDWEEGALIEGEQPYAHKIDQRAMELSDIISFHGYVTKPQMENLIARLERKNRPLFLTEWLARPAGSHVEEQLPLFAEHNIGAFHWGLVNGRTQTNLPWPFLGLETQEWFHDLYHADSLPYDEVEIALFRKFSPRT